MQDKHFAKFFIVDKLTAMNYDFNKCCFFPHKEKEILEPQELMENYLTEREEL